MSARGRLVKRRIYSAVDKSKIKDKRKVKPKDKSWVKLRHSVLICLIEWHGLLCQRILKDRGKYRWVSHYFRCRCYSICQFKSGLLGGMVGSKTILTIIKKFIVGLTFVYNIHFINVKHTLCRTNIH